MVQLSGCVKTKNETKWKLFRRERKKYIAETEIWENPKRNDVFSIYVIRTDEPNEK